MDHSPYSDPGEYAPRWAALSPDADVAVISAVVRNLVYHYRADGIEVPPERRGDIDLRWADRTLGVDAERHPEPIDEPRERSERVAGCCRDFTLLTVSALRERGIPARSRVGFAGYFDPGYHFDHVVVEYHDGARWVRA
ncbi:transglutaminase domain-containing protein, partial [Schumannella luteola]